MWEHATVRPRSLTALALVVCLCITGGGEVFASGKQEDRLSEAKRLIQTREYDTALKLLIQITKDNPDFTEETGALMSQIISIRKQYNKKYEELIDILNTGDVGKALSLINELEALDPHPNPATMASLEKARKAAEVVYTARSFRDLLAAALAQIQERKYAEAVSTYLGPIERPQELGYDLHKKDFEAAGYGEIIKKSVSGSVTRLASLSDETRQSPEGLAEALADARSILAAPAAGPALLDRFEKDVAEIKVQVRREAALRQQAFQLEGVGRRISEAGGDSRSRLYVKYLLQLLGRGDAEGGLITAARLTWDGPARTISQAAHESAMAAYAEALAAFRSGSSARATPAFELAAARAVMAAEALSLETARFAPSAGWGFTLEDARELRELAARAATYIEIGAESRGYAALASMRAAAAGLPTAEQLAPDVLVAARGRAAQRLAEAAAGRKEWEGRASALEGQAHTGVAVGALSESADALAVLYGELVQGIEEKDISYAARLADAEYAGYPRKYEQYSTARRRAEDLANGTRDGQAVESETLPRFPGKAVEEFQKAELGLRGLAAEIGAYQLRWGAELPYVIASSPVQDLRSRANLLMKRALSDADILATLARTAEEQHNRAMELERQGNQAFDKAVTLSRSDPERSSDTLTEAVDAYGKSLLFEDNPLVSARLDKDIRALQESIANAINTRIITEIENLINEGIRLFRDGQYLQARQNFTQADGRWKERHPGQVYSGDLAYYLEVSRNALSVTGSWEIETTDPSYDVVSSYINLANRSYQDAEKLMQQGKKTAAKAALDSAGQNVKSVLALYPNYRVARKLDLQILRLNDEKAFPVVLKNQVSLYLKNLDKGAMTKPEAYNSLSGLVEFLPNDTKLKTTVEQLAYDLGVKERPLDPAKIRESQQLTQQAAANYRKEVPETYAPSLRLLERAVTLNPNNEEARKLRTAILIRSGTAVEGALSKQALADYLHAKDLLNSGSINEAKIIVDRLMREPKNAAYPPLVDLKGKIDARLGI
jgi:hypothetical protein